MPLIDQPGLEEFLKDPPACLNIVVIQGDIWVIHIDEIAHAPGHLTPLLFIGEYGLPALLIEFTNSVFLNILLSVHVQLFFYLDLHGKSVGIPTGLPLYHITLHGLVTQHGVFQRPCHDVMNARTAVGRRRSFIEQEGRSSFSRCHAFFQQVFPIPPIRLLVLNLRYRSF